MMDEKACFHTWLLSLDMADVKKHFKNTARQMMILIKMSISEITSEVAHLSFAGHLYFFCLLIPFVCFCLGEMPQYFYAQLKL